MIAKKKYSESTSGQAPQRAIIASETIVNNDYHLTTITVIYDAGFGNNLYIRGEGPGLNWEKGFPLLNIGPETWIWMNITSSEIEMMRFKILLNDNIWSIGNNREANVGDAHYIIPTFG